VNDAEHLALLERGRNGAAVEAGAALDVEGSEASVLGAWIAWPRKLADGWTAYVATMRKAAMCSHWVDISFSRQILRVRSANDPG
jgi:hypothetical protein